jgi:DNA polymerase III alpha subunit
MVLDKLSAHKFTLTPSLNTNQASLFDEDSVGNNSMPLSAVKLRDIAPWGIKEQLHMEKQALGFYFSASLFDEFADVVNKLDIAPLSTYSLDNEEIMELVNTRQRSKTLVCGVINNIGSRLMALS